MTKKPYWKYKDKTLFEGYKLIDDWYKSNCPADGPGLLCGFPENFINKALNKIKKLLAENKRLKKAILNFGNNPAGFDWSVLEKIEELETKIKKLENKK